MRFSPKTAIKYGWATVLERPGLFLAAALIISLASHVPGYALYFLDLTSRYYLDLSTWSSRLTHEAFDILIWMGIVAFCLHAFDDLKGVRLQTLWQPHPYLEFAVTWVLLWLAGLSGFVAVGLLFVWLGWDPSDIVDVNLWFIVFDAFGWSTGVFVFPDIVFDMVGWTPSEIMDATQWGILWLVLMVAPFLAASMFFVFSLYLVIDRKLGPDEAVRESVRLTKGNRLPVLGLVVFWLMVFVLLPWMIPGAADFGLNDSLFSTAYSTLRDVVTTTVLLMSELSFAYAYRTLSRPAVQS